MSIFTQNPEIKIHLIKNHGLLPIISLLKLKSSSVVTLALRLLLQVTVTINIYK